MAVFGMRALGMRGFGTELGVLLIGLPPGWPLVEVIGGACRDRYRIPALQPRALACSAQTAISRVPISQTAAPEGGKDAEDDVKAGTACGIIAFSLSAELLLFNVFFTITATAGYFATALKNGPAVNPAWLAESLCGCSSQKGHIARWLHQ
jgi:hypothetical protein